MTDPNPSRRLSTDAASSHRPASIRSNASAANAGASPPAAPPQIQEPASRQEQQHNHPPPFAPLYTLVTDTTPQSARQAGAPTTHHPRVHYIFSDDDPDALSAALSASPEADGDRQHPVLLLDVVPTTTTSESNANGTPYTVAGACSLSPGWAVTSARISRMEEDASGTSGGGDGTLMLRIEGVGVDAVPPAAGGGKHTAAAALSTELGGSGGSGSGSSHHQQQGGGGSTEEDYTVLIEEFDKRMAVLRRVVDAGEERRRAMGAELADEEEQQRGLGHEPDDERDRKAEGD